MKWREWIGRLTFIQSSLVSGKMTPEEAHSELKAVLDDIISSDTYKALVNRLKELPADLKDMMLAVFLCLNPYSIDIIEAYLAGATDILEDFDVEVLRKIAEVAKEVKNNDI